VRRALTIARRELGALVFSPVAGVVATLFLLVQGLTFWAELSALADPTRPAPYGAVLRTHYGGTFLHWVLVAVVAAVLTMRAVAEERRQGTWEVLVAAPLSDAAIIVGKWLGALAFYVLLWLPTVVYPLVLLALAPPGAAPDAGPIVGAYLGVVTTGAAFLAIGMAASAATSSQLVAALTSVVVLVLWLLLGALPESAPRWFGEGHLLHAIDVRQHLDDLARGIVDSRALGVHLGVTLFALTVAVVLAGRGRRRASERGRGALGVGLMLAIVLLGSVELARHPWRGDLTRSHIFTLEPRTRQILAEVHVPVRVLVLRAQAPEFAGLYDEVGELLARFAHAQPLITVEPLDAELEPGRVDELARTYQLAPDEIVGGGVVVFLAEGHHRAVGLLDVADFERSAQGGVLREFRGEAAFAQALREVTDPARPLLCTTTGHGELPLAAAQSGQDVAALVRALGEDGVTASTLDDLSTGVPARCSALAILGPTLPFSASEAVAIAGWLGKGGRLLVALDANRNAEGSSLMRTGLETVLTSAGIALPAAVVLDPAHDIGVPLSWSTDDGYADHPITASFTGRRPTDWFAPREVEGAPPRGVTLVRASQDGILVRDLAALRQAHPPGEKGAGGVAAAGTTPGGGRVVVLGSARILSSEVASRQLGAGLQLGQSAVAWLMGRDALTGVGAKTPEQFRVVLNAAAARRVFVLCVVILPVLGALVAALALRRGSRRT
jgi:ABC-2 type transport system permease protein